MSPNPSAMPRRPRAPSVAGGRYADEVAANGPQEQGVDRRAHGPEPERHQRAERLDDEAGHDRADERGRRPRQRVEHVRARVAAGRHGARDERGQPRSADHPRQPQVERCRDRGRELPDAASDRSDRDEHDDGLRGRVRDHHRHDPEAVEHGAHEQPADRDEDRVRELHERHARGGARRLVRDPDERDERDRLAEPADEDAEEQRPDGTPARIGTVAGGRHRPSVAISRRRGPRGRPAHGRGWRTSRGGSRCRCRCRSA